MLSLHFSPIFQKPDYQVSQCGRSVYVRLYPYPPWHRRCVTKSRNGRPGEKGKDGGNGGKAGKPGKVNCCTSGRKHQNLTLRWKGNKNMQLISTNFCKTSGKAMLCVLPATFKLASPATNQVAASCSNTDFWLDKSTWESRHTGESRYLPQNKFALGR